MKEIERLKEILGSTKKIVIVPHKSPDGDAIGSCLGLHLYLKQKGHQSSVVAPNDYPKFLKWLPEEDTIVNFEKDHEKAENLIEEAELVFTLDFNHLSRSGGLEEHLSKSDATFVMIDHHQQPDDYATFTYSDAAMSSTCEMVFHFLKKLGEEETINKEIATCLYVGIMTDTGSFRFASTTSTTHRVIATLIDKGAKNASIHQQVFDTNSYERMQLLGVALNNMKVLPKYKTAYITLSQKELDTHKFKKGDTEGFVNYSLGVEGIKFAAIFIEDAEQEIIKISLRSKGDFDVNKVAREHFDGGGHINAAGGKSEKDLKETAIYFESILEAYKNELQQ
ncbi:DHH family phosphoesterase [Haloflavibacter putidus]|uniref:Bifunctional oligoribonuclease/PAP phosphatase NrnA n=1 Tax=Haloflavibacter putidus TaxID=2576776 RepID=A0A507ZD32_9FLAO|nr:bifunctional oligoribonuclease/PAP phosphatase NrnA [Haloflavibacter putidus]TQD35430.1 bifunctional oligoribonuclease/PAP phosphatase NrnA [Haloflavibacter putidus]